MEKVRKSGASTLGLDIKRLGGVGRYINLMTAVWEKPPADAATVATFEPSRRRDTHLPPAWRLGPHVEAFYALRALLNIIPWKQVRPASFRE